PMLLSKASVTNELEIPTFLHEQSAQVKVRCARFPAQMGSPGTGTSTGAPPFVQLGGVGTMTAVWQVPPTQPWPAPQVCPQGRQLCLSLSLPTRAWSPSERVGGPPAPPWPPEQTSEPVQVVPQPPQFVGSVTVSMQCPPHSDWYGGHVD